MNTILQQLKAYVNSPEGQENIKREKEKQEMRNRLLKKYMTKLHSFSIEERNKLFIAIKKKYDSDEYFHRWVDRGIEPPEDLYYYILQYGYIYGKVNEIEDAHFGYDSYIIDNTWVITAWYGQGTAYNFECI